MRADQAENRAVGAEYSRYMERQIPGVPTSARWSMGYSRRIRPWRKKNLQKRQLTGKNYQTYIRKVLRTSILAGPVVDPATGFYVVGAAGYGTEYADLYFVNGLIRNYGWIAGFATISLELLLILLMLRGTRKQANPLDRCICMTATFFIALQFGIGVLPSLGIQVIPPYRLPFLGMFPLKQRSAWLALCLYSAYNHAHTGREEAKTEKDGNKRKIRE